MTLSFIAERLGQDFLAQTLGRDHLHLPGVLDTPGCLISFDTLNDLLATHRLESPRLRLSAHGETLPQHHYTVPVTTRRATVWQRLHPRELHQRLTEGASLVIDAIDELHEPAATLAATLERHLHTHVQINAYASWNATEGFGTHWDDHDVIVLQIDGAKRWKIYGPTRDRPMYRDVAAPEPPTSDPIAEIILHAGDLLYLPRGWWHAVTADQGTHSLHLTCGLTPHTGADLITWAADRLRSSPTIRTDLPLHTPADEQADYLNALRAELDALLKDPRLLDQYTAARDAEDPGRMRPSLPHLGAIPADRELLVRLTTARAHTTHITDDKEKILRLTGAGNEIDLDPAAGPLLDTLLTAPSWISLGTLADTTGLPVDDIARVIQELIAAQIATVHRGTRP
ncbi:cupin domain-containing protein [Streptomyces sp. NPDC020965]|uniref:cupin domain-containing protein n=1 Tax=Streptomyces sp. NPDC020965 TaxID=3365105 RepID=UPI0037940468